MVSSMKSIVLSVGHYPKAPGACDGGGICEHELALEWCKLIYRRLREIGVLVYQVPVGTLRQKVEYVNRLDNAGLAAELHFNSSGGGSASGCETLYCPGSEKGKLAAIITQIATVAGTKNPDRGVKEGWYRLDRPGRQDYEEDVEGDEKPLYFLKATKPPAIILEPEFIQNAGTIQMIKGRATNAIANGLVDALQALSYE